MKVSVRFTTDTVKSDALTSSLDDQRKVPSVLQSDTVNYTASPMLEFEFEAEPEQPAVHPLQAVCANFISCIMKSPMARGLQWNYNPWFVTSFRRTFEPNSSASSVIKILWVAHTNDRYTVTLFLRTMTASVLHATEWRLINTANWCILPNRRNLNGQLQFSRSTWDEISIRINSGTLAKPQPVSREITGVPAELAEVSDEDVWPE